MESLIKIECPTLPEEDLYENYEPSVIQIQPPERQDSKLSESPPAKDIQQTNIHKNSVKTRELYVKLVRFDSSPIVSEPVSKIRVKDFGISPKPEPETKPSLQKPSQKQTNSKRKQESNKPQQYSSLAAKLIPAYFLRSPGLQSLLNDVLQLQKCYNNPISDSSIETEIRTIKEQYNLFEMDVTETESVDEDEFDEPMPSFDIDSGESLTGSFSSTVIFQTNEPEFNVTEMETSSSDPKLINIPLSNGLVFELDPNVAECPICSKSFKVFNSLRQHLKFCLAVSSNMTESAATQNETPGQFVFKQELSIDSPVKIQQVFSADNMPPEFQAKNSPVQTAVKSCVASKTKNVMRPKSISPLPEPTEITKVKIEAEDSNPSTSFSCLEVEKVQPKLSPPLYYCCQCDKSATTQTELVLSCAKMRKSRKKLADCSACRWKYPGEPFFIMHNQKFRDRRALPLKCSTCRGLMYNHNMFISHEVKKDCTKPLQTVVTSQVNVPNGSDDSNNVITID